MALNEFAVKKGLLIQDPNSCLRPKGLINGTGAPGGDAGVEDAAGIGMLYTDTATGDLYQKISIANDDSTDWKVIGSDSGTFAEDITTATNVDCVLVDEVKAAEWEVVIEKVGTESDRIVTKIYAGHNGTDAADANDVDHNDYGTLCFGSDFNYAIDVIISGTGAAQQMCLEVTSTETLGVDAYVRRTDVK